MPTPADIRSRPLDGRSRPIALPHLEAGGAVRFLGEELPPVLFASEQTDIWQRCDGSRTLDDMTTVERDVVRRWHAAGLVVGAQPWSPRAPATAGAITVISPHPDDAQLALGATLAAIGGHVLDVFSTETWTRRPYYASRPAQTAELLLAEERIACAVLGCTADFLGELDGAERPEWRDGFMVAAASSSEVLDAQRELFDRLVQRLGDLLVQARCVLAPLALGSHVDHVVCREAVLALVAEGRLQPDRLAFYEDMPYALFARPSALVAQLSTRGDVGKLAPLRLHHDARAAAAKAEALRAYRLQVPEGVVDRVVRRGYSLGREGAAHAEQVWTAGSVQGLETLAWLI